MTHDEALFELADVALETASPEVAEAVRAHASICPECGPELAQMEKTVATLGTLAPGEEMNPGRNAGIRSRLIMRARVEREFHAASLAADPDLFRGVASLRGQGHRLTPGAQRQVSGTMKPARSATPRAINLYAMAATVALVITGAQLLRVSAERDRMRSVAAARDSTSSGMPSDTLKSMLSRKDSMIAAMTGPDVKVMPLTARGSARTVGKMMWNPTTNDWIIVTYSMKQPRPGMTYQVWLVTETTQISAGTFRPDANGKTMMHARYAIPRNALRSVAITEEPEGGMPAPTGPMVVAGAA